jgi:cytochrome c biogenesis protein CcdA
VTPGLLAGIAGLALLDALNPATIAGVALILLAPLAHPGRTAVAFVAGAFLTVFVAGTALYLGAETAADAIGDGLVWIRRVAFSLAAGVLLLTGVRRLRARVRPAVVLPRWVSPLTAAPLGLLMTGADLPNAFPYFVAIERLAQSGAGVVTGTLVLAGYSLLYCLPCIVLLVAGTAYGDRIRRRLGGVYDRLGAEKKQPRSVPVAAGCVLAAAGLLTFAFAS